MTGGRYQVGTACEVREKPRNWVSDTKEGKHFKGKRLMVADKIREVRGDKDKHLNLKHGSPWQP